MAKRLKRRKHKPPERTVVGVGWYRREQWERFLEVAADREKLHDDYEDWERDAENTCKELIRQGILPYRVDVDIEELLVWCTAFDLPNDSKARSQYISRKLQQMHGDSENNE